MAGEAELEATSGSEHFGGGGPLGKFLNIPSLWCSIHKPGVACEDYINYMKMLFKPYFTNVKDFIL